MVSRVANRRGLSLTIRLTASLTVASLFVALLVAFLGVDRQNQERGHELDRAQVLFAGVFADRAAPLLDRADTLRLAVLATAARDLTEGRVLVLDRSGRVCIDTALVLGDRQLPLLSHSGSFQRTIEHDDGPSAREALAPVRLGGEVIGEVRLQRLLPTALPTFSWSLFGLVLLGCASLVAVGGMMSHHWSVRVRAATNAVIHLAAGEVGGSDQEPAPGELQELSQALAELDRGMHDGLNRVAESYVELAAHVVDGLERRGLVAEGHAERTVGYAGLLAQRLQLLPEDRRDLVLAARLHDLGKAWVRPSILEKQDPLDEVERESLRQHPVRGAAHIEFMPSLRRAAQIVRHQGEKYDGNGGPEGLRGDRIPLGSRILAIASAYDLLTVCSVDDRPPSRDAALAQLAEDRGTVFDPWLLELFTAEVRRAVPSTGDKPVMISAAGVVPYKIAETPFANADDGEPQDLDSELEVLLDETPPEDQA